MHSPSYALLLSLACLSSLALTGCADGTFRAPSTSPVSSGSATIEGRVHGGQQPIAGAHVYLFAANTSGYGGPGIAPSTSNQSMSLLNATYTGYSDSIGAYVPTDNSGNFSITATEYGCTPNTQVYLYALGGNPGLTSGTDNTAAGLLAALGNCPTAGNFLAATPYVVINEVSTVATAYAFAGFASDATHVSSSGTALAQTGIANAFATATNLETLSTGVALATTPAGNGTVPQSTIDTLANILAACVNTNGAVTGPANPTPCYTLFGNALSGGSTGSAPSDTATAAINIAHNPAANIAALYGLATATPAFAPALASQPNDFTVGLTFTGGGMFSGSWAIAVDGSGNAWITNPGNSVTKLSNSGVVLSGASGYTGGGLSSPRDITVDGFGNAWVADWGSTHVTKLSNSGSVLSGANGFTGGGLNAPHDIAVDGSGNVWVANNMDPTGVTKLSNSGSVLSGTDGFTGGGLLYSAGIAVDGSGNAWVANYNYAGSVTKLSSSGSILSGASGFTGGGLSFPTVIAIDSSGNAWIANFNDPNPGSVTELSSSGAILSGANGFTGGGLYDPTGIAIDGSGSVWLANGHITELSSSGSILSGANSFTGGGLLGGSVDIAIDGSGNVWVATGSGYAGELIGAATPVITTTCAGLPATPTADGTSKLGTRP